METKFYYSYNADGNTYVGKFPAIKNPRRQTEYLLPAMATFKEPPTTKENEIAIWNGENWSIESDFRGQLQIDIETFEISTIDYIGNVKKGFQAISEQFANDIKKEPEKFKKKGNKIVDISDTEEYRQYLHEKEVEERKNEIERELLELDTKRVRAICEPSIKDETTGETWLEYYNNQVSKLREELKNL